MFSILSSIIVAIALDLDAEFGSGFTIYTEEIKQGFQEPCFFIAVLEPTQNQIIGNRYLIKHPFDIHFFPTETGGNAEIYNVAERMMDILEYIAVGGDLLRGSNMRYEVVDGVLHFFVNYDLHVLRVPDVPEESMESITIESNTKG